MDELLDSLGGFNVTHKVNSPHAEHPRFAQYKQKSTGSSQEQRRRTVLEARKEQRYDLLMHLRQADDHQGYEEEMEDEETERRIYRRPNLYKDFVMLSEWLVDVPDDFQSTYLALPCPVGKRALVVSYKGKTKAFTKSGYMVNCFCSKLPGGSRGSIRSGQAILDCIYSDIYQTYYVLDIIYWVNQAVMDCETTFRFEWLKTRLTEDTPEAMQNSKYNPYRFLPIPYVDCSTTSLTNLLLNPMPFKAELDGILFYHRDSHYTHGQTPLVGWLKAFMLKEMLDVPVPDQFLKEMPGQYVNIQSHILAYEDERKKLKSAMQSSKSKRDEQFKMDT